MQCICHNVAAMILLQTGWVAELNLQVSLFNELGAESIIHQVVCKYRETKQSITITSNELLNSFTCMNSVCSINIGDLSEAASMIN